MSMRNFVLLSLLAVGVLAFNAQRGINSAPGINPLIFEDVINETIESIRPLIPDPLQIESLALDFPDEADSLISGNISAANVDVEGLQGFQVTALNFEIFGTVLNFTLVFPVIHFYTDYEGNIDIGENNTNVFGAGNITAHLENVQIEATAQVNLTGGVSVDNVGVQLYLETARFDVHGLYNDEEISANITDILNNNVASLIDDNQALITQVISPIVEDVINIILNLILNSPTDAPLLM